MAVIRWLPNALFSMCFAYLVPAQLVPLTDLKNKISTNDLNDCYGTGVQRARALFQVQYPVMNKLNLSAPPTNIAEISGESKPLARDAGYYAAIVEGMVRCLTAKLNLSVVEVRDLVDMEIADSLLGKACIIPQDEYLHLPGQQVAGSLAAPIALPESSQLMPPLQQLVQNSLDPDNWCLTYPYRLASGYCNNPIHPGECNSLALTTEWGMSFRPFRRFLPPDYDDGIGAPRGRSKKSGNPLPLARIVSRTIHQDVNRAHPLITHMVMQWGQFQDHDITHTPQTTDAKGAVPICCREHLQPGQERNPECFPVIIPDDDDFFNQHGTKCLELARSMPTTRAGCRLGPREQINQVTAYIDGSQIYGSTEREMNYLRSFTGGKLRAAAPKPHGGIPVAAVSADGTNTDTSEKLGDNLPEDAFFDDCVNRFHQSEHECLRAGDLRVNEQAGLASMHTLWMRQHNFVATQLQKINPHWSDERLFQEARKIVGGLIQRITFGAWLPVLLGPDIMKAYDMNVLDSGYATSYNASQDATCANVIASAAHRFGHTLIQGKFELRNPHTGEYEQAYELRMTFNQPFRLVDSTTIDQMIMGMCMQHAQTFDRFMDNQITNHLLEDPPGKDGAGHDLMSRNVQRGRDHGLPSYVHWRAACGFEVPRDFDHLRAMNIMGDDAPDLFEEIYESVDDIDIFPALMSEKPLANGYLGPTVACLIANQFRHLKVGDRFWHENGLQMPSSFTPAQLQEIRKISLARVICDTTTTVDRIQPNVFMDAAAAPFNNSFRPCSEITQLDYSAWREDANDAVTIQASKLAMERKPIAPAARPALQDDANVVQAEQQAASVLPLQQQIELQQQQPPPVVPVSAAGSPASATGGGTGFGGGYGK